MATVTVNLSTISNIEAADSFTTANIPAGGGGATANTEIYLQGLQSLGRRQTTTGTTPAGFSLIDSADNDCSASGTHIGIWFWVTQYSILNVATVTVGSGTTPANVYNGYDIPLTEYPNLGGWVRAWVDPTKTRSRGAGTVNTAAIRHYGAMVAFSTTPGGNAQNLIIDSAHYAAGPSLTLTGTVGLWTDFTAVDENTNNQYGVIRNAGGVLNLFARVQLGTSASSLAMTESGFTIIFPQQTWISTTWMGINVNLENASTDIAWSSSAVTSVGSINKGDLVVTGTLGTFDLTNVTFSRLRTLVLTSATTMTNCLISESGVLTTGGAFLDGCTILNSIDTSAVNAGGFPDRITNTQFTSSGVGHGIEITVPGTYTFSGNTFTGYSATGTTNAAIYNNSGGSVTLNISGGGTVPSFRNGTGASTTIVAASNVTLTGLQAGSEVRAYVGTDPATSVELSGTESSGTTFTFSQSVAGQQGYITIIALGYNAIYLPIVYSSLDVEIPVQQTLDRVYSNPGV